jgi:hypothetical protein
MHADPAGNRLRPHRPLAYKRAADAYLAHGAHMLGGTLCLTWPLIYRTAHGGNNWLSQGVFATTQDKGKPAGEDVAALCRADVTEAIRANGGGRHLIVPGKVRRSLPARWRRLSGQV